MNLTNIMLTESQHMIPFIYIQKQERLVYTLIVKTGVARGAVGDD